MSAAPQIPGYRVESLLGTGGMAAVWMAVQENLGRPVALKVMANTLGLDERFRARFLNEARIVAQLRHPYILSIFDFGSTSDGQLYMITEYFDGGTLKERIGAGLAPAEALRIILALAGALQVAHAGRVFHRDIKPDNVLFHRSGHFVLADFGIAKADGEQAANLTGTGNIVGTPRYMSPEQFQGGAADARTDIYSLGVMLYEMLVGETPYPEGDTYTLALKHIQAPVPTLPAELSRLQPLLTRMLAKDPANRFSDCTMLAAALEALLREDESAASVPTLLPSPIPTVETPQPKPILAMSVVVALVLAGIGGWFVFGRGEPAPADTAPTAVSTPATPAADSGDVVADRDRADPASDQAVPVTTVQPAAVAASDAVPAPESLSDPPTAPARTAVPRPRVAVDAPALAALGDPALESTLGALLRGGELARWESSLAALPSDAAGAHARGRHLMLFERLQAAGLSLDQDSAPSLAAGAPAARVITGLIGDARRWDAEGAKGRPSPPARNAVDAYRMVLALDPRNPAAAAGLQALTADFVTAARTARERGNEAAAKRIEERARALDPESTAALE